MEEQCKNGKHNLVVVHSCGQEQEQEVVRWCSYCGGIVVDLDYDGRSNPGAIMAMTFPVVAKMYQKGK